MSKIREFLHEDDYKQYRNVRAAAVMFVFLGMILLTCGVMLLTIEPQEGAAGQPPPAVVCVLMAAFGLCGVVGGIAVFLASRRWSKLVYVMASLYVLVFPLGTILSVIMFKGLGKYLDNVARFRESV